MMKLAMHSAIVVALLTVAAALPDFVVNII
jgi:hypothetical protein